MIQRRTESDGLMMKRKQSDPSMSPGIDTEVFATGLEISSPVVDTDKQVLLHGHKHTRTVTCLLFSQGGSQAKRPIA
jgi:hypothetical protein